MRFYFQFLTVQTIAKHLRRSVKNTKDYREDFLHLHAWKKENGLNMQRVLFAFCVTRVLNTNGIIFTTG